MCVSLCGGYLNHCRKILDFFRKGACIVDEVDLVMNPLTSELNFPVGNREPLELSPERWQLPMHIFELILLANAPASSRQSSTAKEDGVGNQSKKTRQLGIVGPQIQELREIIDIAVQRKKMQRMDREQCTAHLSLIVRRPNPRVMFHGVVSVPWCFLP